MKKTNTIKKTEILAIAQSMTANDFLNEFGDLLTFEDIDNLLDTDIGWTNVSIEVVDGKVKESICILYVDGRYDSYSYTS